MHFIRSVVLLTVSAPLVAGAAELRGSSSSMVHQHAIAVKEDYAFLRTSLDVAQLVREGYLVPIEPNADFRLDGVSFPYARPEVRTFVRQFAEEFREATDERLVVTSLTRPQVLQPRNAHALSVHPAGIAVDLRVPKSAEARGFVERTLLAMEKQQLIDVTREHTPSHYHVAVFADRYVPYAARRDSVAAAERQALEAKRVAAVGRARAAIAASDIPPPARSWPLIALLAAVGLTAPVALRRTRRQ